MTDLSTTPDAMRAAFLATLDWWAEAGVAEHATDAPGAWLRSPEEPEESPVAAAETAPDPVPQTSAEPGRRAALTRFLEGETDASHPGDPASWPGDLAAFKSWWMESDTLDPPGSYPRVAPHGPAEAEAMLLFDRPQANDADAWPSGPAGTLCTNMLRAMGIAQDRAYFASVLPRHTLRPDWQAVAEAGYTHLLIHHIGLVRPKRVIACGQRVWSLLAHGAAQAPASLTTLAVGAASVPAFGMPDPATLLRNPQARAQTWNRWLDWSDSPR